MDADLAALEHDEGGLDRLLDQLKLWHGTLSVEPGHFTGWSTGARFYPILYMLTRMGGARDWGTGLPLKANLLGTMSKLEVHHIFPKSRLYEAGQPRAQVNALANFCFLQKDTNLDISNRFPAEYFPQIEAKHPGALASQWIPTDPELWEIDRYDDFLTARKQLLAEAANAHFRDLLHGDDRWLTGGTPRTNFTVAPGGIADEAEQAVIDAIAEWAAGLGFARGQIGLELSNPDTGEPIVNLDLAWPEGLQPGLSEPVAVLLGEPEQTITLANLAGYRCFADATAFKAYARGLMGSRREAA